MGLILPQIIKVRTNVANYKHYRNMGYEFEKVGDFIEVHVLDLPRTSAIKVKCFCDFCKKETEVYYGRVVQQAKISCGNKSCALKRSKLTCTERYNVDNPSKVQKIKEKKIATCRANYGVDHPSQSKEIQDRVKETCQTKYGVDNPAQAKEVQDKMKKTCKERYDCEYAIQSEKVKNSIKETCRKKYGVDNPAQAKEVQNKIKITNNERYGGDTPLCSKKVRDKAKITTMKHYGVENPAQAEEVQNKMKETCKERYGHEHALQCEKIKNKVKETCRKKYGCDCYTSSEDFKNKTRNTWSFNNHEGPCSRQQKYLANLINGKINIPVAGYWADIVKENTIIEYDGSGHALNVIRKQCTQEEFDLKERIREEKICEKGYRMIRVISKKDKMPSDEIILNLVDELKNSDFKIIRINIDEGTISKNDTEKWNYNFGKLRRITKKSLEKFESNNDSMLEK